ncbi:TlpA disulfide reductase family protein [Catellatospora sp. NPDC049111]|uniref:TlpA family protein disulfide reductase n=1 Tax=Catellatospora sp. NPDC049111 TaxID=3155271 RepID=UPI0033CA847E
MKRRYLLLAGLAAAGGCGRSSNVVAAPAETADARIGTAVQIPADSRKSGPTVTGELLDGSSFDLQSWRGQVVVVNFWGSWCAPCRLEAADLQATYEATRELGVQFLGVDVRDGRDAAKAFNTSFGITYPSLFDPASRTALRFADVPPSVIPATLVLDRGLRVAAVFRKVVTREELETSIRAVAAEQQP